MSNPRCHRCYGELYESGIRSGYYVIKCDQCGLTEHWSAKEWDFYNDPASPQEDQSFEVEGPESVQLQIPSRHTKPLSRSQLRRLGVQGTQAEAMEELLELLDKSTQEPSPQQSESPVDTEDKS